MLDIERRTAWGMRKRNMCIFGMPFSIDLCNLSILSLFHLTFPIELNWWWFFEPFSTALFSSFLPFFYRFVICISHFYSATIQFSFHEIQEILFETKWKTNRTRIRNLCSFLFNRCLFQWEKCWWRQYGIHFDFVDWFLLYLSI